MLVVDLGRATMGDAQQPSAEMIGFFLHSYLRACVNLQVLLAQDTETLLQADPMGWYPSEEFTGRMEALEQRFDDFDPIKERIGEEMMRLWYEHGPGREIVQRGVDFLRFQTSSEGYRSVIRGPEDFVGSFDLVELDEEAGQAVVRSSTPFDRAMERGVLLGGMQLAGDLAYVDVDNAADPSTFRIEFH